MIFKQIGLDKLEAKNRHNDGLQHFALYGSAIQHFFTYFLSNMFYVIAAEQKITQKNCEKKLKNEK